MQSMVKHVQN